MSQDEIALVPVAAEGDVAEVVSTIGAPASPFLLKRTANGPRLEDWIAANLDLDAERPATNPWSRLVGTLPSLRRVPSRGRDRAVRGVKSKGGWERFEIVYKRGVTIVRLTEPSMAQQTTINELAEDLNDLIEAGNHRIVLNFAKVERLGSWIVAAVVAAHRKCRAIQGGQLKVCALAADLAAIFRIIGMGREITLCDDEAEAVEGPWLVASPPRALPVDLLKALLQDESALPPLCGGAPDEDEESATSARVSGVEVGDAEAVPIKHEVVEKTLIVTPILTDLGCEEATEALRARLLELAQEPLPRYVVVDLEFVVRLSRQTIGVLLAHHLRLHRVGGGLRVCGAHPRIIALLDQVRLTMLVDCYPNVDEAVLASWNPPTDREAKAE